MYACANVELYLEHLYLLPSSSLEKHKLAHKPTRKEWGTAKQTTTSAIFYYISVDCTS